MLRRLLLTLPLAFAAASSAQAQQKSPVSIDLDLGFGTGRTSAGGVYREDSELAASADVALAIRTRPLGNGTWLAAITANYHGPLGGLDSDCILLPNGGCTSYFPGFLAFGALGGWESRGAGLRG